MEDSITEEGKRMGMEEANSCFCYSTSCFVVIVRQDSTVSHTGIGEMTASLDWAFARVKEMPSQCSRKENFLCF